MEDNGKKKLFRCCELFLLGTTLLLFLAFEMTSKDILVKTGREREKFLRVNDAWTMQHLIKNTVTPEEKFTSKSSIQTGQPSRTNTLSTFNSDATTPTVIQTRSRDKVYINQDRQHQVAIDQNEIKNNNVDISVDNNKNTPKSDLMKTKQTPSTNKTEPNENSPHAETSSKSIQPETPKAYVTCWTYDGRRTGNLLFNYAVLMATAWNYSFTPLVHSDFLLLNFFKIDVQVDEHVKQWVNDWNRVDQGSGWGTYIKKLEYLEDLGLTHSNLSLSGFFQSWKYFKSYEERLRKTLVFQDDVMDKAKKELKSIVPNVTFADRPAKVEIKDGTLIALHVRRGDVVWPVKRKFGYTFPSISFFKNSIQFFVDKHPKLHVVVCCDDLMWCQTNLTGLPAPLYFSQSNDAIVDLAILSMAEHVIMTTGTYGWWGAWLANGTTVYYSEWPQEGSKLSEGLVREDYFMPHWIPMTDTV